MQINIKLNDLKYRYDVYQIFNLFYSLDSITFEERELGYIVSVNEEKVLVEHQKLYKVYEYTGELGFKDFLKKSIFEFLTLEKQEYHPWGTLVGIRPSKIAWELLNKGHSEQYIIDYFKRVYSASEEKARLCIEVALNENSFVNKAERNISIYIGMPFCPTRCAYCSFASNPIASCRKLVQPYLEALKKEIEDMASYISQKSLSIETVYFGGGTPTSVNDEQFNSIMKVIYENLIADKGVKEFTVECGRPDSITDGKLNTMKEFKVDRISINPQSMRDETLKRIGRLHDSKLIIEVYNQARELGFDNINMDIIVGLPGEGLEDIKYTCNQLKRLSPESITVHGMSIKRASKLHENLVLNNGMSIPEQGELNSMYEETRNLARELNMKPYYMYRQKNMVGNMENVGYTIKGKECIYNIEMIEEKQTIIALGADAVSKVVFIEENRIERFGNHKEVHQYIENIDRLVAGKIELLNSLYDNK